MKNAKEKLIRKLKNPIPKTPAKTASKKRGGILSIPVPYKPIEVLPDAMVI